MDSKISKTKGIEEEFRSCYPDVSIQHLSEKASPSKVPSSSEKRQAVKTPSKATIMAKTPVAVKSPAKTPNPKSLQNIGAKTNVQTSKVVNTSITGKNVLQTKTGATTRSSTPATPKTPVVAKNPTVGKSPVAARTVGPAVQVAKTPQSAMKTVPIKTPIIAQKSQPTVKQGAVTKQTLAKQSPNLKQFKLPTQSAVPTAKTEDTPDQSSTTVLTYHMPQAVAAQRSSNQLTIEKIEQQQRIPVILDNSNQVIFRQVVNSNPLVSRVAPSDSALQSVVIGTTAQPASPVVAPLPLEIGLSEPLQALQVTQQVTLFSPKGNTFKLDDVKKQITLNKQSAMTNVVSSTTNSIPTPVAVSSQVVPPEAKKVAVPTRVQGAAQQSPVRQSNRPHLKTQQKQSTPQIQQYQTTRGQVKKVSPKQERPTQKVNPLPAPPSLPPDLQFVSEEEVVTTSEDMPQQPVPTENVKLVVILANGKQQTIEIDASATKHCTLSEILKNAVPDMENIQTLSGKLSAHSETFQDANDVQWENSEHIGPEPGEILGIQDELELGDMNGGVSVQEQAEAEESLKEMDTVKNRKTKADSLAGDSPKKKRVCRKRRPDEPVLLTISDDEELFAMSRHSQPTEESFHSDSNSQMSSCDKEPVITDEMITELKQSVSGGGFEMEEFLDDDSDEKTFLQCRTVRIGSYKVVPRDKVLITSQGLKVTVPVLNSDQYVELKILYHEIIKVLIHFGRQMPVLFFYTRPAASVKIRKALKMTDKDGYYYDSTSSNETHRRITFLPEKLDEECKQTLKNIFGHPENNVFAELTGKEANDILVKASPKEVQAFILKKQPNNNPQPPQPFNGQNIETIMIYPPPPEKGGIPINTEDYACLGEDQFLNDVIIDFYLKYVVDKTLSPEDRARTHVFSSFFYKRLTTKPPSKRKCLHPIENDPSASPAFKRHSRVKSWTKNVDLFTKDFIVIPINENSHWFLAIVCFPGLTGPVRFSDNTPIELPSRKKKKIDGKHTVTIGSTTITAVTPTQSMASTLDIGDEVEDRDEADGENEQMDVPDEEEDTQKAIVPELKEEFEEQIKTRRKQREPIKQPCILIFDSLAGASRSRVVATLRDYLRIEYETKQGETRDFSGDVLKGTNVRCPQQTNYTDCGLYVLQYVEAFFQWPITDYHIPIMQLQDWFQPDIVSRKRYEIQQLLHRLMLEQNIDIETMNLPLLNLRPEGKLVDYPCSDEEDEDDEDDQMCEDEEDDMMDDDGEFNEDMEHDEEMEEGEIGHHDEDDENYLCLNMEHEEHEMDEDDYGVEDEDEEQMNEEEELEEKEELEDIPVPTGTYKKKDLKGYRIPRLIRKDRLSDSSYKDV